MMLSSFPAANVSQLRWARAVAAIIKQLDSRDIDTLDVNSLQPQTRHWDDAAPTPLKPQVRRTLSAPAALKSPLCVQGSLRWHTLLSKREFAPIDCYLARLAKPGKPLEMWRQVTLAVVNSEFRENPALHRNLVSSLAPADCVRPLTEEEIARNPTFRRMRTKVRHILGQFLARKIDAVPLYDHGRLVPMLQRFCHLERDEAGVWRRLGGTLDSDAIKDDRRPESCDMLKHNANLGTVSWRQRILLGRSARADTPERVQELLLNTAMAARDAHGGWAGASGVHALERGYEFRGTILTALDLSPKKNLWMHLVPGGEPERPMIGALQRAIDTLFAGRTHIVCTLQHGDCIELRKPLLIHLPLSQEAGRFNIKRAHAFNRAAAMQMFQDLSGVWRQSRKQTLRDVAAAMALCCSDAERRAFLRRFVAQYVGFVKLNPRESLAVDALRLIVLNRDSHGNTYYAATDPERELHAMQELHSQCNAVIHAQCKSGQDRTLTAISTLAARHMVEVQTGSFYDPRAVTQDASVDSAYDLAFTQAADALGANPVRDVRSNAVTGKQGKAKIRHKPIPDARYLPYSDALGLKKAVGKPWR